ncbi:MAG: tRNA pseudouridine(38-40) synthase TruA [Ignavibacteria bacterium]|nr:tRNA pseudouridine(38-40) synthase TruA [Ignavibacteria bacterium]
MYNYKIIVEYDGKDFKGWQKQKYTKDTIQEQIESSVEKILKEKIKLTGAGRTDTGVNAYNQVANFNFKNKLNLNKFRYSLNSVLPASITVRKISLVSPGFHSRFSAKKREYLYKITLEKKSINRDGYYKIGYDLDFSKIDEFIKFISDQLIFKSFCKNKEDKKDFFCLIYDFRYKFIKSRNEIIFSITANRFLHSMVRAIIGCSLEIGRGKLTLKQIQEKVNKGEKIGAHYLPGNALFLNKIHY